MKVLIADDAKLFLKGMRHLVEASGHTVVGTASDGLEAVVKARILCPDVVLMDLHMPGCGGLVATRRIIADRPEVRVVLLSDCCREEEMTESLLSGASAYLAKSEAGTGLQKVLSSLGVNSRPSTTAG